MAPRRKDEDLNGSNGHHFRLDNIQGQGLGYYDRDNRLIMCSSVSLRLLGTYVNLILVLVYVSCF